MKKAIFAIVAVGATLVISAAVPAISASNSSVIKGCVNKQTQVLRVATKCTSNEKSISWNSKGEKGEPGPIGSPGPAGASGSTGATGATGAKGASGSSGSGFDIFDASANVIRDIGSPAGVMSLKDANQVAVSNIVSVDSYSIIVFKNNRFFRYSGYSDGTYNGVPRGHNTFEARFLTSNCTGNLVLENWYFDMMFNQTASFINFYTPEPTYLDNRIYLRGNLSSSPAQLYGFNTSSTCVPVSGSLNYVDFTLLPTSDAPPTLASPIRLTFSK